MNQLPPPPINANQLLANKYLAEVYEVIAAVSVWPCLCGRGPTVRMNTSPNENAKIYCRRCSRMYYMPDQPRPLGAYDEVPRHLGADWIDGTCPIGTRCGYPVDNPIPA